MSLRQRFFSFVITIWESIQDMEPEDLDIEKITEDRRKAIEQNLHVISIEDLKSLGEKLFPFLDQPWRQPFFQFLDDNSGSTFYQAKTDRFEVIYCPAMRKACG